MTDAKKVMHPQHFGTDPADSRITPAIRIGIRDDFWLNFWRWRRFALFECSCHAVVRVQTTLAIRPDTTAERSLSK